MPKRIPIELVCSIGNILSQIGLHTCILNIFARNLIVCFIHYFYTHYLYVCNLCVPGALITVLPFASPDHSFTSCLLCHRYPGLSQLAALHFSLDMLVCNFCTTLFYILCDVCVMRQDISVCEVVSYQLDHQGSIHGRVRDF